MSSFSGPSHGRQLSQESDIAVVQFEDLNGDADFNMTPPFSTSMLSTGGLSSKNKVIPTIRNWPHNPRTLRKKYGFKAALSVLFDTITVLVPLPFLILAVMVAVKAGQPVVESEWERLKAATRLVRPPRLQLST
jgi:hypothetical protein